MCKKRKQIIGKMAKLSSALKIYSILTFYVLCMFLCPSSSVPVIIKNSIKVDKSAIAAHQQQKSRILPATQNNILSALKNTINAGNNLHQKTDINEPHLFGYGTKNLPTIINIFGNNEPHSFETKKLPSTPTTLKLKNAIRVLGYVGNKQIIPIAQQRQASAKLPDDVVAVDDITTGEC